LEIHRQRPEETPAFALQDGCSVLSEGLLLGSEAMMEIMNDVRFAESDVADWMIAGRDETLGGYSIRARLNKLPDCQVRKLTEQHRISYAQAIAEGQSSCTQPILRIQ
jgi:hypothetical protein